MLTHENISANALTSFSGMPDYRTGEDGEQVISFLPLTHIFARALHYGFVYHGSPVYFTTQEFLMQHIAEVQPTIFATVPRVLEKVYAAVATRIAGMSGVQKAIASWALSTGERYNVLSKPGRNPCVAPQGGGPPPVQQMAEGVGRTRKLSYFGRRGAGAQS